MSTVSPALARLVVGHIRECRPHPDADKLYISQIDVSESLQSSPRSLQVCSGLVQFIPLDKMQDARVVIVENLKASKMRGIRSEAMVLAAEKDGKVALVDPPRLAGLGDILHFEGFPPLETVPKLKSKVWDAIQQRLETDGQGNVVYDDEGKHCKLIVVTPENPVECATSTLCDAKVR